ncbi:hypothetical protein XELAEV_18001339mg [Xenopus laevis]|nr:hypothetical protein XELAEV_18001339mg [Xenopus laevis]
MNSPVPVPYCLSLSGLRREMGGHVHQPVGYYLPSQCCPSPHPPPSPVQAAAQLENKELWEKFNSVGTEMILTKSGRRMFPEFSVSLSGLDANLLYTLCVQAVPGGDARYRWRDGAWSKSDRAEPGPPTHLYVHPESPASGNRWMERPICFSKIRLTNNTLSQGGQIVLQSMHRYSLRLYVIPTSNQGVHSAASVSFTFPETSFIAVTSYQNPKLSLLKIEENPFAKGIKFFKSQQESHSPQKRLGRLEPEEESSPGCKRSRESREEENVGSEESAQETQRVSEESAEREEKYQSFMAERTKMEEAGENRNDGRLSRHFMGRIGQNVKEQEGRPHINMSVPPITEHYDSIAQRLAWLSPPAVPQGPMGPYSPAASVTGYRFAIQYHANIPPFHSMASGALLHSLGPNFPPNHWTSGQLNQCVSGPHPQLFQHILPPPSLFLPPQPPCLGI